MTENGDSAMAPGRRFPQFSLRLLMLGVFVCACVCREYCDGRLTKHFERLEISKEDFFAYFDSDFEKSGFDSLRQFVVLRKQVPER